MIYFILLYAMLSTLWVVLVYVVWDGEYIHPAKNDWWGPFIACFFWGGLFIACFLMYFLWPVFLMVKLIHASVVRLFGDD